MYNKHKGTRLDENAVISIDYPEPAYEDDPQTEQTKVDIRVQKIKMGVSSPIEWAMEENPDLNEEQALEFVTENLQRMADLQRRFPNLAAILSSNSTATTTTGGTGLSAATKIIANNNNSNNTTIKGGNNNGGK